MDGLRKLAGSGEVPADWTELTGYAGTSSYQIARALNLEIPAPPDGKRWEFGARKERGGTSTLLVRAVDA